MSSIKTLSRDEAISENIGLVHSCAHRFKGRGIEYDDLFQAGCMGLVKAYDAFDFERGVQFTLLEQVPNTFMWVSPIPNDLKDKFNLVELKCDFNTKTYKDVLIYRKKYHLTKLDTEFISKVTEAKSKYFPAK